MYLQLTRYEMAQSSCKCDTKSKSHPGMKLAPVRVFSCKHPLTACLPRLRSIYLAQPGLTRWGTASAAGCCHVITGTHSPLKKSSFYLASLSPSRAVAAIEKLICQLYQPRTPSSSVKELLRWLPIYPKEGRPIWKTSLKKLKEAIRIIIIVRVFFIPDSNVLTKLIPTINAAAKITAFTAWLPRLRSISLAQPGLTRWGIATAAGCSHVNTGTHSPLKKPTFFLALLSQTLEYVFISKGDITVYKRCSNL